MAAKLNGALAAPGAFASLQPPAARPGAPRHTASAGSLLSAPPWQRLARTASPGRHDPGPHPRPGPEQERYGQGWCQPSTVQRQALRLVLDVPLSPGFVTWPRDFGPPESA